MLDPRALFLSSPSPSLVSDLVASYVSGFHSARVESSQLNPEA